jgi:hypothetical protein
LTPQVAATSGIASARRCRYALLAVIVVSLIGAAVAGLMVRLIERSCSLFAEY